MKLGGAGWRKQKNNRSGSTSVVVVSKAAGKYKEIKSFGSSTSEEELETLQYSNGVLGLHS